MSRWISKSGCLRPYTVRAYATTVLVFLSLWTMHSVSSSKISKSERNIEHSSPSVPESHLAAFTGNVDVLKKVIRHQPELLRRDSSGATVLHAAVRGGSIEAVKVILKRTTKLIHKKDMFGDTPLDEAQKNGFSEISSLLQSARDSKNQSPKYRKSSTSPKMHQSTKDQKLQPSLSEHVRETARHENTHKIENSAPPNTVSVKSQSESQTKHESHGSCCTGTWQYITAVVGLMVSIYATYRWFSAHPNTLKTGIHSSTDTPSSNTQNILSNMEEQNNINERLLSPSPRATTETEEVLQNSSTMSTPTDGVSQGEPDNQLENEWTVVDAIGSVSTNTTVLDETTTRQLLDTYGTETVQDADLVQKLLDSDDIQNQQYKLDECESRVNERIEHFKNYVDDDRKDYRDLFDTTESGIEQAKGRILSLKAYMTLSTKATGRGLPSVIHILYIAQFALLHLIEHARSVIE